MDKFFLQGSGKKQCGNINILDIRWFIADFIPLIDFLNQNLKFHKKDSPFEYETTILAFTTTELIHDFWSSSSPCDTLLSDSMLSLAFDNTIVWK